MTRLIYIANARMPSEKAHGYQIVQMCEAFAQNGASVCLVVPRRINTEADLQNIDDIWGYYDVRQNFELVRLPCLDLIWRFDNQAAFLLQTLTFMLAVLMWLPFQKSDILFSRDHLIMVVLSRLLPRRKLIYEVHNKLYSKRGIALQGRLINRVSGVISMTDAMAQQLESISGRSDIVVAHDGVRPERFADVQPFRSELGIPQDAFVACYAGRLHTMNMSKGLDTFVQAAQQVQGLHFLLVGGPAEQVEDLRQMWIGLDLPSEHFHAVGSVPPAQVPRYLISADVCLITSPHNDFFANETSPMKLFEYMLAQRAILASDLPSTREVVTHGETAYLFPPSDVDALAQGLITLRDDAQLRHRLGKNAAQAVLHYTWQARAKTILDAVK